MKKIALIMVALASVLSMNGQSPSFKTYMNPVIPGDHPDCTLTKVGNDFYTTGSSFNPTPVIYHSTDLVHWEAIAQPVSGAWSSYGDKPGGGCWGGHVVFYNSKFWDYFSSAGSMWFVSAIKPAGPWSQPTRVNNPTQLSYSLGYDNSIFIDDTGKWYMVVKNGQPNNAIVELGTNGQPTGIVYDMKWLNPSPSFPFSWAEGPVMWKYKGYYYYSFARDVSGGQKVMRSKTLTASQTSWEILGDFFNENDPQKASSLFASPNHASPAVLISDSTSWVIHPLYAKGEWKGQGRQGLLNQVRYNASGRPVADYPDNQSFTTPKLPSSGIPWMVPKSDFFTSGSLNPEWSFLGYTPTSLYSLSQRPGWLRLTPKSSTKANTVIKNDGEHNYSLITRLDFSAKTSNDEAGLRIIRSDETLFVKLCSSMNSGGKKTINFSFDNTKYEIENTVGDTLWLKIIRINHSIGGYFSGDGNSWTQVGQNVDVSAIDSYSDFSTWIGTRQGLYVQGSLAFFDFYIYRDAYTPILAECPANQSGTSKTLTSSGISVLDNIHNNDWALYAGVEFGNTDYRTAPDSVEFTVSCSASGGTVEVWLDSIATGTKIGDCQIVSTGSWNTFKRLTAKVNQVKGTHDVYLNFIGAAGTTKLFQLKWMSFIRKSSVTGSASLSMEMNSVIVYPNPFLHKFSLKIDGEFQYKIFTLEGKLMEEGKGKNEVSAGSSLATGAYLVNVTSGKKRFSSKIIKE